MGIYGSIFSDPITDGKTCALPGFEGLLVRNLASSKWMIAYNDQLESPGRIRFSLAHEFGHYLMHRSGRD
ncbi:ImmA/IrrE family metallo-endopeptidase [Pseudomonas paracarnis]|uniref:ImmA/IrrE family metallo-endopeptidase n=1 Tax=Pseudomonas paracarnis TaxID=2750625 RepID=UPI001C6F6ACF|nr:ImmA/IrrE family metallo-endopeptidase [Pseudomonas paracarnis]